MKGTWTDLEGIVRKLPSYRSQLAPGKNKNHKAIVDFVRVRDGHTCRKCGRQESMSDQNEERLPFHIDHIIPRRAGGSHHPRNLQLLCPSCHSKKTARECCVWPTEEFPTFKQQKEQACRAVFGNGWG